MHPLALVCALQSGHSCHQSCFFLPFYSSLSSFHILAVLAVDPSPILAPILGRLLAADVSPPNQPSACFQWHGPVPNTCQFYSRTAPMGKLTAWSPRARSLRTTLMMKNTGGK